MSGPQTGSQRDKYFTNWEIINLSPAEPWYALTAIANSVDPDQLASDSEEANWSGFALFVIYIKYVNLYQQPKSSNLIGWKLEVGGAS